MNADHYGDAVAETGDDAITAAFAAYKADAPSAFEPPPVDDLIMSGPASLRRRRLISLAAVLGACTAVTAGGFAVAQTLGSTPDPEPAAPPVTMQDEPSAEEAPGTHLGEPLTPETGDDEPASEDTEMPEGGGQVLVIDEWTGACAGGEFGVDLETWEFADESEWTVEADTTGDLTGDDTPETVLALSCDGQTAVAAFTPHEDGLDQLAWVWQPDESQSLSEIVGIEDGAITLQGLSASETWTARYEWDGEAFVEIDEVPTTEPSSPEPTATAEPGETQTTSGTPTADGQE
ncbi:hypothetical protein L0U85_18815 [Glycomyces sp. L485]|uniref:hypothetical protein n=1 Tax=Glycomyces sp. L485 TaxID=2909235 RepID=UPI001F4B6533|nr:hypothetical protein [Glycomyces sp. L485]MCH7232889.1 hypothetical protein [Glycomyces sp. L485]